MQASTSYKGACPICRHEWTPGVTGTQCTFGGYRTLLPAGSRGRQAQIQAGGHTYEYGSVELRPKAQFRDIEFVRRCLAVVEAVGMATGGHKTAPNIARLPGFTTHKGWYRFNPPELMHDSKIFLEMLLKCMVGKLSGSGFYNGWSYDTKHRMEAEIMGIFPSIWRCNNGPLPWRLTPDQRKLLDDRMVCTSVPLSQNPH